MTQSAQLRIAGIHFALTTPPEVRLASVEPLYAPFLHEEPVPDDEQTLPVELCLSQAPATTHLPTLFETGQSWRVCRDGVDLILEHWMGDQHDRLLWIVRLAAGARRAWIWPGPELLERRSDATIARHPLTYPLDQLLLMHLLPGRDGLLLHAAGFRVGSTALVFPGRSGAGKSTLTRLLSARNELHGLSDDRIVVRRVGDCYRAFGTPWAGTEGVATSEGAALGALAFLHQAGEERLERLSPKQALDQLLPVASILWYDPERLALSLETCEQLLAEVPAYELHFRETVEVAATVRELIALTTEDP